MALIANIQSCLDDFKVTLDADVKSLVELHNDKVQGPGRPARWQQAIRRSSVVLLAANLENFCEETACSGLSYLASINVVASRYPESYRLWLFRKETHMRNIDAGRAKECIELSLRLYSATRPLTTTELELDLLKKDFANPTPPEVDWLVELLGQKHYLEGISVQVLGKETPAKAAINELASRRNKIAHGDTNEIPTIEDVERLSKFCHLFANRFSKDISDLIQRCI